MATFLRIGAHVINTDLVTDIMIEDKQVTVFLGVKQLSFQGEDATKLHAWIDAVAQGDGGSPQSNSAVK